MNNINDLMNNWRVSYDPYSDLLQMYDDAVFKVNKSHFIIKKENDIVVYISKNSSELVLVEMKGTFDKLKVDVNNLVKSDIINLIKPYITKYV